MCRQFLQLIRLGMTNFDPLGIGILLRNIPCKTILSCNMGYRKVHDVLPTVHKLHSPLCLLVPVSTLFFSHSSLVYIEYIPHVLGCYLNRQMVCLDGCMKSIALETFKC